MSPELSNIRDDKNYSIKLALADCDEPYMVCIKVFSNVADLVVNVEHALVVQILQQIRADWISANTDNANQQQEDIMTTMIKYVILYFKPASTLSSDDDISVGSPTDDADTTTTSVNMNLFETSALIREWIMEGIRRWCDLLPPQTDIPYTVSVDNTPPCCICLSNEFTADNAIPYPCSTCRPSNPDTEQRLVHRACWIGALAWNSTCPLCRNQLNFEERSAASQPSQPRNDTPQTTATTDRIETALTTSFPAVGSNVPYDTIGLAVKLRLLNTRRGLGDGELIDLDVDRIIRTILKMFEADIHARGREPPATASVLATGRIRRDVYVSSPNSGPSAVLNPYRTLDHVCAGMNPTEHVHLQPMHVPERRHWVLLCQQWSKEPNSTYGYTLLQNVLLDSMSERVYVQPSIVLATRFMTLGEKAGRGTVTINPITCSQQSGGSACGLFACAWYYLICAGLMNPFAREGEIDHPSTFEFDDEQLFEWCNTFTRMGKFTMSSMVGNGYCAESIAPPPYTRIDLPTLPKRRNKRAEGYQTNVNPGLPPLRVTASPKVNSKKRAIPSGRGRTNKKQKKVTK